MARPRRDDGMIHLHEHKDKDYVYAVSRTPVDDENGKRRYTMETWGTIEDGKFMPNMKFLYRIKEKDKFVFDDRWDLSEIDKHMPHSGRPSHTGDDSSKLYGSVWFLEQVAEKTGLMADLMKVFNSNKIIIDDIMTAAMFPLLCPKSMNHLAQWQTVERLPSSKPMTPCDVTRLQQSITEQNRMDLFTARQKRAGKNAILAIDSTSKSTYGNSLVNIRYGKNKEGLPLKQTNEIVAYSLGNHWPVYFREIPGNINDHKTVKMIFKDLKDAGFSSFTFLSDRGYDTEAVLDFLMLQNNPFILAAKTGIKRVREIIAKVNSGELEMDIDEETGLYFLQMDMPWFSADKKGDAIECKGLKLNLFRDTVQQADDIRETDIEVKREKKDLELDKEENAKISDRAKYSREHHFYRVSYTEDDRVESFRLDSDKVFKAKETSGFFGSWSHLVKGDAMHLYHIYKSRDEQEKYFNSMKNIGADDRNRTYELKSYEGRRFITFVRLTLVSWIKYMWSSNDNLHKMFATSDMIIDEMKNIRCIEHRGHAKMITPFVGKQLDICREFGFEVPDGCGQAKPKRINSATGRGKVGRPPKASVD